MKKIVITGGHLTPALAVMKKLQEEGRWQILFIGRKHTMEGDQAPSIESQIVPKLGVDFVSIKAGRVQRKFTRYFFLSLFKIPLGFFQSFYYLGKFHPDIILSFGGYLAIPVVLTGWLLGVPVVTHEQSVRPGLATRVISLFAKKIAVSWKETLKYFPERKVILTGNPLREEILKSEKRKRQSEELMTLYITGGNQGAHVINEVVRICLPELLKKYEIIHQCGTVEYYGDYQRLKTYSHPRYRLARWFGSEEVAEVLKSADLVVSRAGANTVFELAFLGKPAILIPFPFLREQMMNAKALAKTGMVEILPQEELTVKSLVRLIDLMTQNLEIYGKKAKEAKKLVRIDASEKVIAEVKKCVL